MAAHMSDDFSQTTTDEFIDQKSTADSRDIRHKMAAQKSDYPSQTTSDKSVDEKSTADSREKEHKMDTTNQKSDGFWMLMPFFLGVLTAFIGWYLVSSPAKMLKEYKEVNYPEVRLMLVGKTGAGKSASGNTILGEEAFRVEASPASVSLHCERRNKVVDRWNITVIDTPGFTTQDQASFNKPQCIDDPSHRPHVFLLVIRLGRFTEEEVNAVKWIQETFGGASLKFIMILLTGGDQLEGKPVENFISDSYELKTLVDMCDGRYHVFNNNDKNNQIQVTDLLKKIHLILHENLGYTHTKEAVQKVEHRRLKNMDLKIEDEKNENKKLKRDIEESYRRLIFAICTIMVLFVIASFFGLKYFTQTN